MGRYEFRIEGWLDRFGGFRRDFRKKLDAGVAQTVDFAEGRVLVEKAGASASGSLRKSLGVWAKKLKGDNDAELLLGEDLAALMDEADERPHRLSSPVQLVDAERLQARFSSWYELFPRSETDDPQRHGTFADVIERLPAISAMGLRHALLPADPPDRQDQPQGPQQQPRGRRGRSRQSLCDRQRRRRPHRASPRTGRLRGLLAADRGGA